MSSVIEQLQQYAVEAGATHAKIVASASMEIKEGVRLACEMNACGKCGRNWTCPPYVGELDECEARLRSYPAGVLIQNIAPLEDSWDFEGMAEASQAHNRMVRALAKRMRETSSASDVLPLGCGGCDICETCPCPDEPCRHPEIALASVEGCGVDVKALVESVGLHYINGVNTVSYVGLLLLR